MMTTSYNHHHTPSSATAATNRQQQQDSRMDMLLDENDHKRCAQANQQSLLHETLGNLRKLTKEIHQDDWMFVKTKGVSTATRMK
jgi:hypothetical protein